MIQTTDNYEKMKRSMSKSFLQYDQAAMIQKFSLKHDAFWLYLSFINRSYRIHRNSGVIQWSDNAFETSHEADYNEAMTIYDVLCYAKDGCQLSHEFVNLNSLSTVLTGTLSQNTEFFQRIADFFSGKLSALHAACISLSGKELKNGDIAFELELFPFLPVILRFWEADDEFSASLQILVDKNTLDYMHYETIMFALNHLFHRLKGEMSNEKG